MPASDFSSYRAERGSVEGLTSGSSPIKTILPSSLPLYLAKSWGPLIFTRTTWPRRSPDVPGVHALAYAISVATSGLTIRTLMYSFDQPRPKGPHGSRWELESPNSVSLSRVHSLARFMLGEPVKRWPTPSIRPLAVSMIFEL